MDRGWSWAVLGGSMGGMFVVGIQRYFVGVMHAELLHKYRASNTVTAWVGALYVALMDLCGLVASAVIGRYGCRVCCIVGGVLCFLGFGASAFTTSITQLFFTYGVVAGIGSAFVYTPTVICVGYYFKRLLALASGLASSAAAVGLLCGPVLIQTMVNEYRVSGGFLLLSAITLHHCVSGMLFRPNDVEGSQQKQTSFEITVTSDSRDTDAGLDGSPLLETSPVEIVKQGTFSSVEDGFGGDSFGRKDADLKQKANQNRESLDKDIEAESDCKCLDPHQESLDNKPEDCGNYNACPLAPVGVDHQDSDINLDMPDYVLDSEEIRTPFISKEDLSSIEQHSQKHYCQEPKERTSKNCHIKNSDEKNCHRKNYPGKNSDVKNSDAKNSHIKNYPGKNSDVKNSDVKNSHAKNSDVTNSHIKNHHVENSSVKNSQVNNCQVKNSQAKNSHVSLDPDSGSSTLAQSWLQRLAGQYRAVLTNKAFMLHCVGAIANCMHQAGVYLHLPEYVQTLGTSPNMAAELFIAAGCGSLVARLTLGVMTTDSSIDPLVVNIGLAGLCGLITMCLPLYAATYAGQLAFSLLLGVYTGSLNCLLNVLNVRFVGVRHLHSAFGVSQFLSGLGTITGPLVAAMVVDYGGRYELSFIILGCLMLSASFLDLWAGAVLLRQNKADDVIDDKESI